MRGGRRLPASSACDFCGAARAPAERRRLVWRTGPGDRFVLAEFCGRCAGDADRLLERHGGRGRESIALEDGLPPAASPAAPARAGRTVLHGLAYLMIALAFFVVVTLVTSRG